MRVTKIYLISTIFLGGCGLTVPEIKEPWEGREANRQISFGIKKRVLCELQEAIYTINRTVSYGQSVDGPRNFRRYYPVPLEWGARISISLTIDEKSAISPSATLIKPLENALTAVSNAEKPLVTNQLFNVGLGAELSATSTRIEKFDAFYPVEFLNRETTDNSVCLPKNDPFKNKGSESSPLIVSELGLQDWLLDSAYTIRNLPSIEPKKSGSGVPPDTFSIQLKFVIVTTGSVNPSWRLVRVTSNTAGLPLFAGGRTRTHDLLITIGPPNKETSATHLASQIGQAINANTRGLLQP